MAEDKRGSLEEHAFRNWYAAMSRQYGLNPDPDAPEQFYDYRAAFRAGAKPDATKHWPSQFKRAGHPNEIVGGFNTRTGERVPGTPRGNLDQLIALGWEPETAAQLVQVPEPQQLTTDVPLPNQSGQRDPRLPALSNLGQLGYPKK